MVPYCCNSYFKCATFYLDSVHLFLWMWNVPEIKAEVVVVVLFSPWCSHMSTHVTSFVVVCAAILGEAVDRRAACAIISCPKKTHKETKRRNVGRHAVNDGPAGRQNRPHVDWKNGGLQLDCRFILTWHAAGRVAGCDDWRKEEKENGKHLETSDVKTWGRFCLS